MNKRKNTLFNNTSVTLNNNSFIMAIETSCDETACAIVQGGRKVISNIVASQIKTHEKYGGVIPEIAARKHLEAINVVIDETFKQSGLSPDDISAFACTVGPGLVGCLLVGMNAAKSLALVYDKPFIGVNHLNAHVSANFIDTDLKPPFIALLVSGGHTQIIDVKSYSELEIIGETIDDAVGEAYDKVARLIGLPYPGGAKLDELARQGNPNAFKLPEAKVGEFDFSFSGLKTAVLRLVKSFDGKALPAADICASFQECVSSTLIKKVKHALEIKGYRQVVIAGGVAANSEIRRKIFELKKYGCRVNAPIMKYCTDNASMVASSAFFFNNTYDDIDVEVFSRVKA
ncbi:MAG: tRNA (adenosine(37)-N6)-threonylcarbamoyltransferase complex transferase subunit TsaD [Candidatus Gastranaerophilales bacterium]|nr:tRNA (adenosine(37)-N6)-threonylcarbamoyltransferase complex transferase subunit TsaD [Candidatus Gastranaerophilales bacterium]